MINLTDNAKTHLNNYLQQVRTCLKDCSSIDADEVEQNIKEHIEGELQDSSEPISYDALDAVLKRLGSPQQWVPGATRWFSRLLSRWKRSEQSSCIQRANSLTISDPDRSIAARLWRKNFLLRLSALAVMGVIDSFSRFLVLLMMASFRNIFSTSLFLISQSVEKRHFTSTRGSFHYLASKRVIA